jgi:hypothetical protein
VGGGDQGGDLKLTDPVLQSAGGTLQAFELVRGDAGGRRQRQAPITVQGAGGKPARRGGRFVAAALDVASVRRGGEKGGATVRPGGKMGKTSTTSRSSQGVCRGGGEGGCGDAATGRLVKSGEATVGAGPGGGPAGWRWRAALTRRRWPVAVGPMRSSRSGESFDRASRDRSL